MKRKNERNCAIGDILVVLAVDVYVDVVTHWSLLTTSMAFFRAFWMPLIMLTHSRNILVHTFCFHSRIRKPFSRSVIPIRLIARWGINFPIAATNRNFDVSRDVERSKVHQVATPNSRIYMFARARVREKLYPVS